MKNIKKAIKFLREISGKTGLFFHVDTDGVCTAAQMIKYLETKNIKPEIFCGEYEEEDMRNFLESKFDNYIFLDICIDEFPELFKKLKSRNVLIIDHHPSKNLSKFTIHINPRFDDPDIYISASEICFALIRKLIPFEKNKWIARLGGVGDKSLEGTEKETEASDIVDAVKIIKKKNGLTSLAKFLSKAEKLEDLLYENRFWQVREKINSEIEKQISEYELTALGEITFFHLGGKFSLTSIICNKLFDMYPKRTIIVYRKVKDGWKVSGRSHEYDLGKIFQKAAKGMGRGGGHPRASGAQVSDIEEFKRRVLKMIG